MYKFQIVKLTTVEENEELFADYISRMKSFCVDEVDFKIKKY